MKNASPTTLDVGQFVDSIAGDSRTIKTIAERLLGEVVELCLASGLTAGEIHASVSDTLFNQCLKTSEHTDRVVFPSELHSEQFYDDDEIAKEVGDVSFWLKDLMYQLSHHKTLEEVEEEQFDRMQKKTFYVKESTGIPYAIKPHMMKD